MAARAYTAPNFVVGLAQKARTPILMIQTESTGASSIRFGDIIGHGITDEVRDELRENDIAFITFDSTDEGLKAHDELIMNFPHPGETTLGITAVLGLSTGEGLVFEQAHGGERSLTQI